MDPERYKECMKYFEERVFGIRSYFYEGYITITAFSAFDMLRFISDTEPEFIFGPEMRALAYTLGLSLPSGVAEVPAWKDRYLNITEITADIRKAYERVTKK
jgi:adenine/guanine phosphoribosyltransferase-like PRPP-binding protein